MIRLSYWIDPEVTEVQLTHDGEREPCLYVYLGGRRTLYQVEWELMCGLTGDDRRALMRGQT